MYKHPKLDIVAPREVWNAAAYHICQDGSFSGGYFGFETLLVQAIGMGKSGTEAVAWAIGERTRQYEEQCRNSAKHAEAKAISELAEAIAKKDDDDALKRIMSQLSEKTQFAVKAQLRRA